MSDAKPKIANYHFTTLEPSLGVVKTKSNNSFVMADIPGIIEGASMGTGLGIKFLRHVERTRLLLHVIDISESEGRDLVDDYHTINKEIINFSENLSTKPQIIVGNKSDILSGDENIKKIEALAKAENKQLVIISAASRVNLDKLVDLIEKELSKIPKQQIVEIDYGIEEITLEDEIDFEIERVNEEYYIKGPRIEALMRRVNINDFDSVQYMQRSLIKMGVMKELRKKNIQEGQSIDVLGYKFEWED